MSFSREHNEARFKLFLATYLAQPPDKKNAAAAVIAAGYSAKGAKVQGHKLLSRPEAKAVLAEKRESQEIRLEIQADEGLQELRRMMTSWHKSGELKPAHVKAAELFCIARGELPSAHGMIEALKRDQNGNTVEMYRAAWVKPVSGDVV